MYLYLSNAILDGANEEVASFWTPTPKKWAWLDTSHPPVQQVVTLFMPALSTSEKHVWACNRTRWPLLRAFSFSIWALKLPVCSFQSLRCLGSWVKGLVPPPVSEEEEWRGTWRKVPWLPSAWNHHPLRNGTTCSEITIARHCLPVREQVSAVEHLGRSIRNYTMRVSEPFWHRANP